MRHAKRLNVRVMGITELPTSTLVEDAKTLCAHLGYKSDSIRVLVVNHVLLAWFIQSCYFLVVAPSAQFSVGRLKRHVPHGCRSELEHDDSSL